MVLEVRVVAGINPIEPSLKHKHIMMVFQNKEKKKVSFLGQ